MTGIRVLYISAVRDSADGDHIEHVQVHNLTPLPNGEQAIHPDKTTIYRRETIVSMYEAGNPIKTAVLDNGGLVEGEDVHVVEVNGVKYIRTDRNETAKDNLDSLPRFTDLQQGYPFSTRE
ncbi:MAG: DUF3892 domain-containing protein [Pirellulaceae bacterium]